MMRESTKRGIVRWIHIALAIPIVGYIYSPFAVLPQYAPPTRYIVLPAMLLSGLWMWKGHVVRGLIARRAD
jgi:hypothetical protein